MAQSILDVRVTVVTPWWLPLYIGALKFFDDLGMIEVNPDVAVDFVMRHVKVRCEAVPSEVDDRTARYFERAPFGHHVCPDDLDLDRE